MVTGIRGFDSEDFIESNEVHVYGQEAIAFMEAMEPKPSNITFVMHKPGDFIIEPLPAEDLEYITQRCAIQNMYEAKANSEGKVFTGEHIDDDDIIDIIIGKKVTISAGQGHGHLLAVGDPGEQWFFDAEFAPIEDVPLRSKVTKEEYGQVAEGLHWDGNPWNKPVRWEVRYDIFAESPAMDNTIRVFDARESIRESTWGSVQGFGNVSKYQMFADLEIEDHYEDDMDVILNSAKAMGFAITPIYMYSHSGDTIRTTPFYRPNGRRDYGLVGFAYIMNSAEFSDPMEAMVELVAEIDHYIQGNSYSIATWMDGDEDQYDCDSMHGPFEDAMERSSSYAMDAIRPTNPRGK